MNPIEQNAFNLLDLMVKSEKEDFGNDELQAQSALSFREISDALEYLDGIGAIKTLRGLSRGNSHVVAAHLLSRGRYLYHEIRTKIKEEKRKGYEPIVALPTRPLNPIGSPYGFTEYDWETVALQKENANKLFVVLGLQFNSDFYDTEKLGQNLNSILLKNIEGYNKLHIGNEITLNFERLAAGYGEHLFNDIARSIIGADIAIFESSNLNPNVMIEMGVALTWGVRVLLIRKKGCPKPPSDISGQTWIEYDEDLLTIFDDDFEKRLRKMIERVMANKIRNI